MSDVYENILGKAPMQITMDQVPKDEGAANKFPALRDVSIRRVLNDSLMVSQNDIGKYIVAVYIRIYQSDAWYFKTPDNEALWPYGVQDTNIFCESFTLYEDIEKAKQDLLKLAEHYGENTQGACVFTVKRYREDAIVLVPQGYLTSGDDNLEYIFSEDCMMEEKQSEEDALQENQ